MADPTADELYAIEIELELRKRKAEQEAKQQPSITKASPEFEAGSAVRQGIPDVVRRPISSVANVLRQGPEFAALGSDIAGIPFRAADKALGFSDDPVFQLKNFRSLNELGDTAFGKPNTLEKLIGSMGLGAGTGMMTQSIGPIRGALAGGMGYLGGEGGAAVGGATGKSVAEKLNFDPEIAKAIGEVGGGVLGGFLFGIPPAMPGINTANRLASEGLKGTNPLVRNQMAQKQDELARAGIFSMPSQLSENPSPNLIALQNRTLGSGVGSGSLEERIQRIIDQARNFGKRTVESLGPVDDSTRRANEVQDVIERVIDLPRTRAREAARPFYKMLELDRPQLSVDSRFNIAHQLADINEQVGLLERSFAGKAAIKAEKTIDVDSPILRAISTSEGSAPKAGEPFRLASGDIYSLDNYMKELRTRIDSLSKLSATSKEMVERAGIKPAFETVRSELLKESPVLRAAKDVYQRTRDQGLQEVRSTGIPNAKPLNVNPGPMTPTARWEQFKPIIETGNADDVRRAAALIRGRDGDAFRDVVKNWLKTTLDESFMPGSGNKAEPKQFAEKVLSNPNLDAILEEAAKGVKGIDPTEFAVGFKKALKILQASGRPVQGGSSMDISRVIGGDPMAVAGRFAIVHELGRKAMLASKYFEWAQNKQWQKLYDALNSPDSMRKLSNMADMAEMNPRTASYLSTIVGGTVAID